MDLSVYNGMKLFQKEHSYFNQAGKISLDIAVGIKIYEASSCLIRYDVVTKQIKKGR